MKNVQKPSILFIDDEADELNPQVALRLDGRATANVLHPRDVEMSDLKSTDLVLVDNRLDRWPERDAQSVSLKPANGMALTVVPSGAGRSISKQQVDGVCAAYWSSRRHPGAAFIGDRPVRSCPPEQSGMGVCERGAPQVPPNGCPRPSSAPTTRRSGRQLLPPTPK